MKSKRLMVFILILIVVVLIAGAGVLYAADRSEVNRQAELTDAINMNQVIIQNGLGERQEKEAEIKKLERQLAEVESLISKTEFLDSAESIEYDRIFFSIADTTGLQVTSLTATEPLDIKEGDITYQITTFTITVENRLPGQVIHDTEGSIDYIDNGVNNILAYISKLATGEDFLTTDIQSVNILAPEPMSEEEINDMLEELYVIVEEELSDTEKEEKTEEEILLMAKNRLFTKSASEIRVLQDEVGLEKPSAIITVKIWTYKGGID